jgi:pectate lyase
MTFIINEKSENVKKIKVLVRSANNVKVRNIVVRGIGLADE